MCCELPSCVSGSLLLVWKELTMNLTLSVDERIVWEARRVADAMGKSLNHLIREYLTRLTAMDDAERDIEELRQLSDPPLGDSRGWKFNRDEIHERA
ncbi:MAG: MerR family transcriptional regulator [bacterium]|nr:MerR family transcriptional regulator [bacterium]